MINPDQSPSGIRPSMGIFEQCSLFLFQILKMFILSWNFLQAVDPNTQPRRHYQIVAGNQNYFQIDELTGDIRTTMGLDYEKDKNFVLVISTREVTNNDPQYSCTVNITVLVRTYEY